MPPPRIRPSVFALFFRSIAPRPHPSFHQRIYPQQSSILSLLSRIHLHRSSVIPSSLTTATWYLKTTAKIFLTFHLLTTYIGSIGPTHGISMVPTIPHSYRSTPYILTSHLHRHGRNITVGDVITFSSPASPSTIGCKRVIGMPGDFVSVLSPGRGNADLGKRREEGDWANVKNEVVRVPEGHCWVAGDNLEWSRDSRVIGAVPLNLVRGKVLAVVWPTSAWKVLGGKEGLRDAQDGEYEPIVAR